VARHLSFWVISALAIAVMTGTAGAQIGSRCLGPEMPPALAPSWVSTRPPLESQEVSARLVQPANAQKAAAAAAAEGRPAATTLDEMCKEPREAIRLAQSGKYKEAVEAGRPLLALPREKFRDYTWDYLANAIAWSGIQSGDRQAAAMAHNAAIIRIDDPAIADYHRIALVMLQETKKSAAELKDYAIYQGEIRAGLKDRLEGVKQSLAAAQKARFADTVLRHLRDAYEKLRVLVAADPETGRGEPLAAFRKAATGLTVQAIPPFVSEARRMQKHLDDVAGHGYHGHGIEQTDFGAWNSDVAALWAKVQEIKRLCRIQDYLVRENLSEPCDCHRQFQQAHECLFVPGDTRLVWQKVGQMRIINTLEHMDIRLRVPWQETRITPWGVPFSGQLATPPGMKPLGPMDPLNGQMDPMTGQAKPMDGQMQPMDGQTKRIDGQMQPMKPVRPK
jgi:hypothetical protein